MIGMQTHWIKEPNREFRLPPGIVGRRVHVSQGDKAALVNIYLTTRPVNVQVQRFGMWATVSGGGSLVRVIGVYERNPTYEIRELPPLESLDEMTLSDGKKWYTRKPEDLTVTNSMWMKVLSEDKPEGRAGWPVTSWELFSTPYSEHMENDLREYLTGFGLGFDKAMPGCNVEVASDKLVEVTMQAYEVLRAG